jgi:hypothetical protein
MAKVPRPTVLISSTAPPSNDGQTDDGKVEQDDSSSSTTDGSDADVLLRSPAIDTIPGAAAVSSSTAPTHGRAKLDHHDETKCH